MGLSAGVFAADEATVTELCAALGAAGYSIGARATIATEEAIESQLASWIDDAGITVVVGTGTDATRAALASKITKRLLGFSDLREIDGGRCGATIVVLVPDGGGEMASAITKVLPRIESELAGKPAATPPKVSIPARPAVSASSSKHLPPVVQRVPVVQPQREVSVVAAIPPVPKKGDGSGRTVKTLPVPGRPTVGKPPPSPSKAAANRVLPTEEIEPLSLDDDAGAPVGKTPPARPTPPPSPSGRTERPARPTPPPAPTPRSDSSARTTPPPAPPERPVPPVVSTETATAASASGTRERADAATTAPLFGTSDPAIATAELIAAATAEPATTKPAPATTDATTKPASATTDATTKTDGAKAALFASTGNALDLPTAAVTSQSLSSFDATAGIVSAKRRPMGLLIGAGAAVVAIAVITFLMFGRSTPTPSTARVATPTTPMRTPGDEPAPTPSEPAPTEPTPGAPAAGSTEEPPHIEIDEPDAVGTAPGTTPRTPGTPGTTRTPGSATPGTTTSGTTRPPGTSTTTPGGTSTKKPTTPAAAVEAPVAADGCDKVSCVIDAYARPCCEQYRPRKPSDQPLELDRAMITSGMSKGKPAVIRCGEQHPTAKGIVRLAMKVAPDGRVEEAGVSESPDPALGECVSTAVRKLSFAKTETGGSFAYPFKF